MIGGHVVNEDWRASISPLGPGRYPYSDCTVLKAGGKHASIVQSAVPRNTCELAIVDPSGDVSKKTTGLALPYEDITSYKEYSEMGNNGGDI
jgi:hypothetical protein